MSQSLSRRGLLAAAGATILAPSLPRGLRAQTGRGPLRIEITEGVVEPLPFALPEFLAEGGMNRARATEVGRVVADNLINTGLFREIPQRAHVGRITSFDSPVQYSDWRAINVQALITGAVSGSGDRMTVKFRLFDIFGGAAMGEGMQFTGPSSAWRRLGHRVADAVYSRITGEGGYFDSRVTFISESGPKDNRRKRLAVMDQDGANVQFLSDDRTLVMTPRFAPDARSLVFTSFESGQPRAFLLDLATMRRRPLTGEGEASFAARFSPDGRQVVLSQSSGSGTDIFQIDIGSGRRTRLTSSPSIATSPSFSPDGRQLVFESDRAGNQQIYIMPASGGEARRISFGAGRYATPVWSPRGDLIAFTKQHQGRFHIGIMRTDGSDERLLTASFLDEGPSWAPNGRVLMFFRETPGPQGAPALFSVDVSGRNLRRLPTPDHASDPGWSGLLS